MTSKLRLATVVAQKIKMAAEAKGPEADLMFKVFDQAVRDRFGGNVCPIDKSSAKSYLRGELPHLQILGIDPEYVRDKFRQAGVAID